MISSLISKISLKKQQKQNKKRNCKKQKQGARDEHAVRPLVVQNGEDLPQDVRLILKHGKSVDTLAEMQVGEVEKFHRIASLLARPGRGVMLPL